MSKEEITAQSILDKQDLHWMYHPSGDSTRPMLHDVDCRFCDVEDRVLIAMEEYAQEKAKEAIETIAASSFLTGPIYTAACKDAITVIRQTFNL